MNPTKNNIVNVELAERSYDIIVGADILPSAGDYIKEKLALKKTVIITDENLARHHLDVLQNSLGNSNIKFDVIILEPGEKTKSFNVLEDLLNKLLELKIERGDFLIAFGGGVIGDLVGFVASILRRGIKFVQIPTSLLSQVDSSVGGKTGINTKFGKNLIGSFYQPSLVLADISLLKTLTKRHLLNGYAEVLKYGLLGDRDFFTWLDDNLEAIINIDEEIMIKAVTHCCMMKADIVKKDEREEGVRALLNLGHTFGHALETETGYSEILYHGEGVACGISLAFMLSNKLNLCSKDDVEKVQNHLRKASLPLSLHDINYKGFNAENLLNHIRQDKKVVRGKLNFILANEIGDAFMMKDIEDKTILNFLNQNME